MTDLSLEVFSHNSSFPFLGNDGAIEGFVHGPPGQYTVSLYVGVLRTIISTPGQVFPNIVPVPFTTKITQDKGRFAFGALRSGQYTLYAQSSDFETTSCVVRVNVNYFLSISSLLTFAAAVAILFRFADTLSILEVMQQLLIQFNPLLNNPARQRLTLS